MIRTQNRGAPDETTKQLRKKIKWGLGTTVEQKLPNQLLDEEASFHLSTTGKLVKTNV